jgi:spermidine synthase
LILGIGLGSVVRLLDNQKSIESIVAIDIDPVVIQLAKKYWPEISTKIKTDFLYSRCLTMVEEKSKRTKF